MDGSSATRERSRGQARSYLRAVRLGGARRRLLTFLVLTTILVALLPVVVSKTPLRNSLLSFALPRSHVRVTIGDATLGWFSRPSLSQVEVRDADGNLLLAADRLSLDRTPGSLLLNWRDLGSIEVVHPTLHVAIRPDGSNLEDVANELLTGEQVPQPAGNETASPVTFAIRLVDGTILVEDLAMSRSWRGEAINLTYDTHGAAGRLGRGTLTANIVDVVAEGAMPPPPGRIAVSLDTGSEGQCKLSWQAERLALALVEPWLRRSIVAAELSGGLSSQGTATWTAGAALFPSDFTTTGTLWIDQLDASAALLNGDRLKLLRVELPWRLMSQPAGLKIEDLQLRGEIGRVAVRGMINAAPLSPSHSLTEAVLSAAGRHDVELRGALDLARIAAMLPRALRIREDTSITSGTIEIAGRCRPSPGGQLLTASLSAEKLAATSAGRPIRWDQPVNVDLAVNRAGDAIRLDSFACRSDFLHVAASGTFQQFSATADFDLTRFAQQLGQFVDLAGLDLAGSGKAELTCEQPANDQLAASGGTVQSRFRVDVTDLRAICAGWNIDEPRVELTGDARWNGSARELGIDNGQFVTSTVALALKDMRYRSGGAKGRDGIGQLSGVAAFRADLARLTAWRGNPEQAPTYKLQGELTGNLRFAEQSGRISGELSARGANLLLAQQPAANSGTAAQRQSASAKRAPAYDAVWQEPQLTVAGLAMYDPQTDRLEFNQLQLQSNTLQALVTGQVEQLSTASRVNVTGTLNYDLAQVTPLLRPYLGNGIQLTGREQARFAMAGQVASFAAVEIQPVGFSRQSGALGTRGPSNPASPWSRRLHAQLELPWSGANVYGLPVGPGRMAATLGDGAIRIEPLSLAVGEGRLTVAPVVRLDPEPAELTLPAGPIIANVRISPEVSEAMLKYVAPVLAGATQSEGLFSLAIQGARVPLGDPQRADSAGQLSVHSVRVVPGPVARQWIALAEQIEAVVKRRDTAGRLPAVNNDRARQPQVTLLAIRDQQVNFRVADGRVHHQNMEFQVGDVTMRSQGSVGFDETISLTLQVPIQDAWIANQPLLAGFKGQSLQVPISGTLTRPQMDQRAIASLGQQLLQGGVQQAVGGELNKALDKLFKSR